MRTTAVTESVRLPEGSELLEILRLSAGEGVAPHLLAGPLLAPLRDFLARPGKNFRGRLVEIGFLLGLPDRGRAGLTEVEIQLCQALAEILEAIHAGSLIVDDIQDGSRLRRGDETLHRRYGTPVALNAGNFLYFLPLQRLHGLGLDPKIELAAARLCHETLLRAHMGQAIDLGTRIDQVERSEVEAVCLASLQLKSGALMALALTLGALVAGASQETLNELDAFGHQFGVALQMFDDIGNLVADPSLPPEQTKRFEDLYLRRPSWVWGAAARLLDSRDYGQLVDAVRRLPNESFLIPWIEVHQFVPRARELARDGLETSLRNWIDRMGQDAESLPAVAAIRELAWKVANAYG